MPEFLVVEASRHEKVCKLIIIGLLALLDFQGCAALRDHIVLLGLLVRFQRITEHNVIGADFQMDYFFGIQHAEGFEERFRYVFDHLEV